MAGVLTVAEKFFWSMVFIVTALIVALFILSKVEDIGDGSWFGRAAEWVSVHLQPRG